MTMRTYRRKSSTILLAFLFLLCSHVPARAFNLLHELGALDTLLSEFNPVGHHIIDPVNKAVPRLHLQGFLRLDTTINVHKDDHSVGIGNINKDWRANKIEWLMELEGSYRLNDNWQLCGVVHTLYDGAYDWQNSRGLYGDKTNKSLRYYHTGEEILREFYLKGFAGNFDFYLGKQQVVWGKMEGRVLDIVNPEDARESPPAYWQDDYEYRRIPLWMANVTYRWSDYSLQALWIPKFEPNFGPIRGGTYFPPFKDIPSIVKIAGADKPSTAFKDHIWGLRFNTIKGNWDFSLVYFYTWSYSAANFRSGYRLVSPQDGFINLIVTPRHTRLHQFGGNVETSFYALGRSWVVTNEILYTLNRYYSVDDESLLPWNLEDGVSKHDDIFFGSRWMTSFFSGELNVIFQPLFRYIVGFDKSLSTPGSNQQLLYGALTVISKSYKFTADRLNTTYYVMGFANANPSSPSEGCRQLFEVNWRVSDFISTKLYYEWYAGDHAGIYGAYDAYDNVGMYIKYEF